MRKRALVILSGGQDSTTCLFWAKHEYTEVHAITFDYGQRHDAEIVAAKKISKMAGVASHEIVRLPQSTLKGSPLLKDDIRSVPHYKELPDTGDGRQPTFVPNRNLLFLVIAANRLEVMGGGDLIIGVSQADSGNYDDCRAAFLSRAEDCIAFALGHDRRPGDIEIVAPLLYQTKAQTVKLAAGNPECWDALAYTVTSYDGEYPPVSKNHANLLRAKGFLEAGLPDPLVLRAWREGLMELPETDNYRNL